MKTKLIALALFGLTAAVVTAYPKLGNPTQGPHGNPAGLPDNTPHVSAEAPRVEVVFVLDTTGSMGGLIQTAKEKIWSIATTMASAQPAPEIRMGLVAYRDRGDDYVTRVTDLSTDLDSVYATLMDFSAQGGGDGPESVNAALSAALDEISWSQSPDTYRVVFLVGDAPPHMDYAGEERYPDIVTRARDRGIVVNTIRCGNSATTDRIWRQIASISQGDYFTVAQGGSGIAITTPYDAELASLSAQLDATRLFYGEGEERAKAQAKTRATEKLHGEASDASRARRAAFNTSGSGETNQFGDLDLVAAVSSGKVRLDEVAEQALPAPMQAMAPAEREAYVAEQTEARAELRERIRTLAETREAYLAKEAASKEDLGRSLDYQLYESVRAQAAEKGISYEAEAPRL